MKNFTRLLILVFYTSKFIEKLLFRTTFVLLVITGFCYAQDQSDNETPEAEPEATPKPIINRVDLSLADLEALKQKVFSTELSASDIDVISDGTDEFAVLWQDARGGRTLGALLLVHGAGQTPDWPGSIDLLRTTLPEFGWTTLSISVPDPLPKEIPARTTPFPLPTKEKTENESETPNEETSEVEEMAKPSPEPAPMMKKKKPRPNIEKQASGRIDSAIKYLHQKGQFNIIIVGEGLGAARVAKFADKKLGNTLAKNDAQAATVNQRMIRSMILINARNQIHEEDKTLPDYFNYLDLPILDIYTHSHYLDTYEPQKRAAKAKKNQLKHYQQIPLTLSNAAAFEKETLIIRRIRGFLEKHAKGVELEKTK